MSIIKPRTRGKHFVEHRTRLDRENHETLYAYAAFLDEDVDYVLNQLIENVLERDREFSTWRAEHQTAYAPERTVRSPTAKRRHGSNRAQVIARESDRSSLTMRS